MRDSLGMCPQHEMMCMKSEVGRGTGGREKMSGLELLTSRRRVGGHRQYKRMALVTPDLGPCTSPSNSLGLNVLIFWTKWQD